MNLTKVLMLKKPLLEKIKKYQNYDGGFGLKMKRESHAGATNLALKMFSMFDSLYQVPFRDRILKWLVNKQDIGLSGRVNKGEQ